MTLKFVGLWLCCLLSICWDHGSIRGFDFQCHLDANSQHVETDSVTTNNTTKGHQQSGNVL